MLSLFLFNLQRYSFSPNYFYTNFSNGTALSPNLPLTVGGLAQGRETQKFVRV
jgi:hypothetical protein